MATMYSLFLGFLFNVICRGNGDGDSVVGSRCPVMSLCPDASGTAVEDLFRFIGTSKEFIGIQLFAQAASGSYFFSAKKYAKNSSLKTFDTKSVHPSTIVKNFVGDKGRKFTEHASLCYSPRSFYSGIASTPLQDGLMSPVKHFAIEDDLLAYGVKGRKAIIYRNSHFALGQDFQSKGGARGRETLETASVALLSRDEHRVKSLDLCGTFYQGKVPRRSANEDRRNLIITIASNELGVKEATGNNDGPRIEQYLRYTNLGPGYEWCAAFVSWVYGQAGLLQPRNPWSPALFPKAQSYKDTDKIKPADLFAIYSIKLKRIHHVGLIKEKQGSYIRTIEGNSNDRVESRRRYQRTVYSYAEWID